ncbi:MAG TPA: Ig domain-containing protein, partial [Blastocatellia bacterium]|nr:Ig domain-containing protein [Blastocatellia bacterium]
NIAISVTGTVTPPTTPVSITTTSLAFGSKSVFYSQQLSATGGTPPYTWAVTSGALPPGVSLSAATGLLSGTPTLSGSYTFMVTVRDALGGKASRTLTANIR